MVIGHPDFVLFLRCALQNKLRYLCIGGYAVNFHGFHRVTEDMDIWIAPENNNKLVFLNTLLCMGYTESELVALRDQDFVNPFLCTLGERPHVIDVLTIVHQNISFDEAEKSMILHRIDDTIEIRMVSYEVLKDIKTRSSRSRDHYDIYQLDKLRKA